EDRAGTISLFSGSTNASGRTSKKRSEPKAFPRFISSEVDYTEFVSLLLPSDANLCRRPSSLTLDSNSPNIRSRFAFQVLLAALWDSSVILQDAVELESK